MGCGNVELIYLSGWGPIASCFKQGGRIPNSTRVEDILISKMVVRFPRPTALHGRNCLVLSVVSEDREAEHVGLGHFVSFLPTIHASSPKLFVIL